MRNVNVLFKNDFKTVERLTKPFLTLYFKVRP